MTDFLIGEDIGFAIAIYFISRENVKLAYFLKKISTFRGRVSSNGVGLRSLLLEQYGHKKNLHTLAKK